MSPHCSVNFLGEIVSVLITNVVPGLDPESYDQLFAQFGPLVRAARGFRAHAAYAGPAGMTVAEIWDSEWEFQEFFTNHIQPNLPPGAATPLITTLHNATINTTRDNAS